jgi:hypothetical protein
MGGSIDRQILHLLRGRGVSGKKKLTAAAAILFVTLLLSISLPSYLCFLCENNGCL